MKYMFEAVRSIQSPKTEDQTFSMNSIKAGNCMQNQYVKPVQLYVCMYICQIPLLIL